VDDYGVDVTEIGKVIDTADVLVIRFQILDERLLIDNRTNDVDGPLIAVVPKAGSVEERFKSLKKLRPRFPLPEKITSFMWPRRMDTFRDCGLSQRIESRLVSLGGEGMSDDCRQAFDHLNKTERSEVVAAITGGEGYETIWQRRS
jgi:hypothetical protein